MKTVSMLDFRRDAAAVIQTVQSGESLLLTYRGKPAVRLEPVESDTKKTNRSLLSLCELGEKLVPPGPTTTLTNEEIDRIVYDL